MARFACKLDHEKSKNQFLVRVIGCNSAGQKSKQFKYVLGDEASQGKARREALEHLADLYHDAGEKVPCHYKL